MLENLDKDYYPNEHVFRDVDDRSKDVSMQKFTPVRK